MYLQILRQIILTFMEIICLSLLLEVNKTGVIKNICLDIKIQFNTTRIIRPADTRLHMDALSQEHFVESELFSKVISRRHLDINLTLEKENYNVHFLLE